LIHRQLETARKGHYDHRV